MLSTLLLVGIAASAFVGFNIGGSSTGIAWGPAVGAGLLRKGTAAAVMTVFVFLGGWTVGRNVIDTLAGDIVAVTIPLEAGVGVLLFIGLGILAGNLLSVPVPTSMTTVGSIGDRLPEEVTAEVEKQVSEEIADAIRDRVREQVVAHIIEGEIEGRLSDLVVERSDEAGDST